MQTPPYDNIFLDAICNSQGFNDINPNHDKVHFNFYFFLAYKWNLQSLKYMYTYL